MKRFILLSAIPFLVMGCHKPAAHAPTTVRSPTSEQADRRSTDVPHQPIITANSESAESSANELILPSQTTDPAIQPDPTVLARITDTLAKTPVRPLPSKADVSKSFNRWQVKNDYWRRVFVDGFRALKHSDAALTARAETFLSGYCLRISDSPEQPSLNDLMDAGRALHESGVTDPHVTLALCALFTDAGLGDAPLCTALLQSLEESFQGEGYSPWLRARYHRLKARLNSTGEAVRPASGQDGEVKRQHTALLVDYLLQLVEDPDLADADRQMLVLLMDTWGKQFPTAEFREPLIKAIKVSPDADEWVREIMLCRQHLALGWTARGEGYADTVTQDAWRQFGIEMERARSHALRAWDWRPELPEAAVQLIQITMTSKGVAGEDERFWFDEAVKADFSNLEAYNSYAWSLRPRWGGSHYEMLQFAKECLDTGRFDTEVPNLFHSIVSGVVEEQGSWKGVMREAAVYDGYVQLFGHYEHNAQNDLARNHNRTMLAAVAWLAGKKREVRRHLSLVGDQIDTSAFTVFGLSFAEVQRGLQVDYLRKPFFPEQEESAVSLAFLDDEVRLIQGGDQGAIAIWNIQSRERRQLPKEHSTAVTSCVISKDGQRLITASKDGKVIFWNTADWEPLDTNGRPVRAS